MKRRTQKINGKWFQLSKALLAREQKMKSMHALGRWRTLINGVLGKN